MSHAMRRALRPSMAATFASCSFNGARSCFRHLDRTWDRLGSWLDGLQSRPNKVVVALAAKTASIVWVVLTKPGALYERRNPAFA